MRRTISFLTITAAAILFAGCQSADQPTTTNVPEIVPAGTASGPVSLTDLRRRLRAAEGIMSVTVRDEALQKISRDAGAAGQPGLAKEALGEIASVTARDTAASECAVALTRKGQLDGASEIAGMIASVTLRDQTLAQVAKGG